MAIIDLYTAATPNGRKVSIMLEELGAGYTVHSLDLSRFEHKEPWFVEINPNGKIPAIVDNDCGTRVFESGAILIYLADKFGNFVPPVGDGRRTTCIQWLMFQMSAVGPMQGQLNVFLKYAPEKIPYAIRRYTEETKRIYSVLDTRLSKAEYLAGEYSIADIATWPWVNAYDWVRMDLEDFPHLARWRAEVGERPAVLKGKEIPEGPKEEETEEEKIERIRKLLL